MPFPVRIPISRLWLLVAVLLVPASLAEAQPTADETPIWKTITIGTYKSVINLREALDATECGVATPVNSADFSRLARIPCKLGDSANEILGRPQFDLSSTPTEVELLLISGKDLGFPPDSQPSLAEIYERAESRGFELCSPEVGPQLRLQYINQKIGEFLRIAMRPVRDYAGNPVILTVGNGGTGLMLIASNGNPDTRIPASSHFVFKRSHLPADRLIARERPSTAIERIVVVPDRRE